MESNSIKTNKKESQNRIQTQEWNLNYLHKDKDKEKVFHALSEKLDIIIFKLMGRQLLKLQKVNRKWSKL